MYLTTMGVLGTLVKTAIGVNQKLRFENGVPIESQRRQLIRLLQSAQNTAIGKYYNFEKLLEAKDVYEEYAKIVPIHRYEDMKFWWDRQQVNPDITWPGKPDFFALTSGTTGKESKRIPITDDFLNSMKKVGNSLVASLPDFDLPEEVFESRVLMLGGSTSLKKNEKGFYEGPISGINIYNFPNWYDIFYAPGREISRIENWDERIARIVEKAPEWNIGAIAGIPSWILLMLNEIIKHYNLEKIQEIWPAFSVFVSGGVAFETYRKDFEKISSRELTVIDTYLASEGFFAYTHRPNDLSMKLALSHGYFYEFIPLDERGINEDRNIHEDPMIIPIDQVELNQEYILVISSCAGAWRYVIGDTVRIVNLSPPEIDITGRLKHFLNVVGAQLSEEKLDAGIVALSEKYNLTVNQFSVAALKDEADNFFHQWCLVSDDLFNQKEAADFLDETLQEMNENYRDERTKALTDVRIIRISQKEYNAYLEAERKKDGQIKMPKVMSAERMGKLLNYCGVQYQR